MNSVPQYATMSTDLIHQRIGSGGSSDSIDLPLSTEREMTKPKRPLSAYNFFYKIERAKILGLDVQETIEEERLGLNSRPVKRARKHRKTPGMIGFKELAKKVSSKWRSMNKEERQPYQDMFEEDRERYQREMMAWTTCQPIRDEWRFKEEEEEEASETRNQNVPPLASNRSHSMNGVEGHSGLSTNVFQHIGFDLLSSPRAIAEWEKACPSVLHHPHAAKIVPSTNSAFNSCLRDGTFKSVSPAGTPPTTSVWAPAPLPRPYDSVNDLRSPRLVTSSDPLKDMSHYGNSTFNAGPLRCPSMPLGREMWHCNYSPPNRSDSCALYYQNGGYDQRQGEIKQPKNNYYCHEGTIDMPTEMQLSPIIPYENREGNYNYVAGQGLNDDDMSDLEEDLAALCEDEALTSACTIKSR